MRKQTTIHPPQSLALPRPATMMLAMGLVWLVVNGGCFTAVCRSDSDCQAPTPKCVLAQCKACRDDLDCGAKRCDRSLGQCVDRQGNQEPVVEIATEPRTEPGTEPTLEPANEATTEAPAAEATDAREQPVPERKAEGIPEQRCREGESRTCYSGPQDTMSVGACQPGKQTCDANAQWGSCVGEVTPVIETCDGLDNDCDGKVDEICGPKHTYAWISSLGVLTRQRNVLQVTKAKTGLYTIKAKSSCLTDPMFASVFDERRYQGAGISCAQDGSFEIGIVQRSVAGTVTYADSTFYAVIPLRTPGEIFGTVDGDRCTQDDKACVLSKTYGEAKVKRLEKGVYEISATPCSNAAQPIFLSTTNQLALRALAVEIKSNKCYVRIFDGKGALTDEVFSFWLPDSKTNAFVQFEADGTIKGKNDFGDQQARWTVKATKMGAFEVYSIAFPAWLAPSAALVTPYNTSPKQLGLYPMATDLQVYPFNATGPTKPTGSTGMSVLFVQ